MNYLSHLYIAHLTQTDLAGAVAADFVRGPLTGWPEPLRTGMALHRLVDRQMDSHPQVLSLKRQFNQRHRRMAGILLDMAFDHQLAKHWSHYHPTPLPQFAAHCYQTMTSSPVLPDSFRPVLIAMQQTDWLSQYQHRQGIDRAIRGIAQRLSQPDRLLHARDEIWRLNHEIYHAFTQVLPELVTDCQHHLRQPPAQS
ncbi:ACP phosphodiesterase [Ferrimonas pelagia]|uniref:ACP phosphodiesterase n=1 Tax=Ferrimonas pelagia TaxID=1177826 RepID=A0ABP9F9H2_9GAMM